jgi:hypothetical protein
MATDGIKVIGLKEFRAELKAIDLDKGLAKVNYEVAQYVVTAAQSLAGGVSRLTARGARSFKPSRSGVAARITLGGSGAPEAAGAEFGARRFPQFQPWRGDGDDAGYALWPTIRDRTPEVIEMHGDAIEKLMRPAFPT